MYVVMQFVVVYVSLQVANMLCGRAQRWPRCTAGGRLSHP